MKVLGMISGTSHDGIDVAVVDFELVGSVLEGRVLHTASTPYPAELRARLIAAMPPAPTTLAEVCELDTLIGQSFAGAAVAAIEAGGPVDLVVSHGQTVYHWVEGAHALGTLQIGQPAWIAERTGAPVLSDVRIRDITAGGHGAPLVSVLDGLLLGAYEGGAGALNLGGIANVTVVRGDTLYAYDIGPANALIDAVVTSRGLHPRGFDEDGRIAASGRVHAGLLEVLLDEPYYRLAAPKSTGKELFHLDYVDAALVRAGIRLAGPDAVAGGTTAGGTTAGGVIGEADLVATLTELTVRTVAHDVRAAAVGALVVSGGGCRNPVVMDGLRAALPGVSVSPSDEFGAPADDKEAIAFALIGWLTAHGLPGTVPGGTGAASARILGTLTPGAGPIVLPAPVASPPRSLRLA
ncbi:anhydro-N-acetylmuramic acid kinase [Nonomuraea thailandensis]|uniref:Anhydro-N-acetylmuramic acid kinase n=1 Tax=Nonomuraea thailandensis TaxID=1188745 RepID=A0A9X2GI40_9ACTN|nr:anhydro-N-acetylmuramic acid kinase [Nonomuraea thailandensis]MCP2355128.1 anhydro-N-acetylmuramic acid kinase [Nonomuraea thailandensis]